MSASPKTRLRPGLALFPRFWGSKAFLKQVRFEARPPSALPRVRGP